MVVGRRPTLRIVFVEHAFTWSLPPSLGSRSVMPLPHDGLGHADVSRLDLDRRLD